MKATVQRVSSAKVEVENEVVGEIGQGLLVFLGFGKEDEESGLAAFANKIANLRIFSDENGRFKHSLLDIEGGALVVSQFTLYADTSKGRRPEFFGAKDPVEAEKLYNQFISEMQKTGLNQVQSGQFGAMMSVSLVNDGPVTINLEG